MVKDRGTGQPKLTCRNWECGVLVPAPPKTAPHVSLLENTAAEDCHMLDLFKPALPVPIRVPGSPYGQQGGVLPWFFQGG